MDPSRPISSLYTYRIAADARLAIVCFTGVVTGADMLTAAQALHADPDWEAGMDVVWDCSNVLKHIVGPEEVAPLLGEEVRSGGGADVLVENGRLSDTLLSNMLVSFLRRRGKPASLHRTLDEALAAIGHDRLPPSLRAA